MLISRARGVEDGDGVVWTLSLWLEEPCRATPAPRLCIRLEAEGGYRDLPAHPGDADRLLTATPAELREWLAELQARK